MKNKASFTVNVYGVNLEVEGYYEGGYFPATREQPEEVPEFNIESVTTSENIVELLTYAQLDKIYSEIR